MTNATNSVAINNLINEVLRKYFIVYPEKQEGYTPVLVNVDCPVSVEDFSELSRCVRNYDLFTKYIENYKQEKEAEKRNKELNLKFKSILAGYGIEDICDIRILKSNCGTIGSRLCASEEAVAEYINEELFKEDDSIKQQNNVTTNNSTTEVREETIMKKDNNTTATNNSTNNKEVITMTNEMIKKLDNLNRTMQLVQVLEWCDNINNVHDVCYVKKDVLAQFLFDKDLIGRQLSKRELKKITRDELIANLRSAVDNLINAGVITPVNTTQVNINDSTNSITIGNLDITHDNAPESIEEPVPVADNPVSVSDAKAKTVEVLKLIKDAAVTNHNKGFGTTVSAYMLCAYILQAGYGIKKLKGHESEITTEQKDTVKRVRQWLIDKGYIKACVYKTNGKSVYTDDYDGNHAASMVHHSKSLGLTCVGVSSYKVTF